MKKHIIVTLFVLSGIIFNSCTTVYVPSEVNTPVFKGKNEFRAGVSYGNSGLNVQTAYSFTDHLGLIASGSYINSKNSNGSLYQKYGEFGIGYFKMLKKNNINFEVFTGIGFGNAHSTDHSFSELSESGKYYKIFLQPDMTLMAGGIDIAFAIRFHYLGYTSYSNPSLITSNTMPASVGMEPSVSFIIGDFPFKFKYQLGLSAQGSVSSRYFGYTPFFTHVGFVIAF